MLSQRKKSRLFRRRLFFFLPFRRKPESLRRQPHSPTGDHSASRKILAVARMRFRLSPEWKGERVRFAPPNIPFPRKRESPCHSNCFGARCRETVRGWGDSRFRGNGKGVGFYSADSSAGSLAAISCNIAGGIASASLNISFTAHARILASDSSLSESEQAR